MQAPHPLTTVQNFENVNSVSKSTGLFPAGLALKRHSKFLGSNSTWIISDSRSAIQHLYNWHKVGDNTGVAILEKIKHISSREIHLQWVPSHVNIADNQIADSQAKDSAAQPTIQNCTPPTSTASKQLFLLFITGMRLNAVFFSFNATGRSQLFWPHPNFDF
ncbi:RNase H domain-containing protein [Trichonephila clavipes]|nr:RNase H domain-containing protein [Trichonephila clavipes]